MWVQKHFFLFKITQIWQPRLQAEIERSGMGLVSCMRIIRLQVDKTYID